VSPTNWSPSPSGCAREDVEEAELDDDPPVPATDTAPVISACALIARQSGIGHRRVEARDGRDEGPGRDLAEEPRADKVRRHHPRDVACELRGVSGLGLELGDREGQGSMTPSVISIRSGPCCAWAVTARRPNSAAARSLHPII
jgi:hypothetical protein